MVRSGLYFFILVGASIWSADCSQPALAQDERSANAEESAGSDADSMLRKMRDLGAVPINAEGYTLELRGSKQARPDTLMRLGTMYFVAERDAGALLMGFETTSGTIRFGIRDVSSQFEEGLGFPPLPEAPQGLQLRHHWTPPVNAVRVTGDPSGRWLYVLTLPGDVWRYDTQTGQALEVIAWHNYVADPPTTPIAQGLCFDDRQRMYVVSNVRDTTVQPWINRATVWRSDPVKHGEAERIDLTPWSSVDYPYGIHNFNHGVGHVAQGPDGMIYVGSGSRTDANEDSPDERIANGGEVELTACLWRLDPDEAEPEVQVYARGLRNPFGFDWDDQGRLWATDNGPNADPPGELNLVEEGKHYGFPYAFADWAQSPYGHTPAPPDGVALVPPVVNLGPGGGGSADAPMATFSPHSSPNGLAFLGDAFPPALAGKLAVVRFGNQIRTAPVGCDLLLVEVHDTEDPSGRITVKTTTLLESLCRPLDVHATADGRLFILEHSREQLGGRGSPIAPALPGRLLEMSASTPAP